MSEEQLVVGFIRGPHGVSGEFKVESASGYYEHIVQLKEVTLKLNGSEKKCTVESAQIGNSTLYMKVAEINSPEDVRKYNGWGLSVPRKFAHPLEKDEYYIKDLIGCSLIFDKTGLAEFAAPTPQFETVGTITDALEGGAGYLLEVSISESCTVLGEKLKFTSSGKQRKVLIPFTLKHICNIDVKVKTIQLMHLWILE